MVFMSNHGISGLKRRESGTREREGEREGRERRRTEIMRGRERGEREEEE